MKYEPIKLAGIPGEETRSEGGALYYIWGE
jgi:hypothetical protein